MAKFVATVLTAMFFAASGSAPPWVATPDAVSDSIQKYEENNDKYNNATGSEEDGQGSCQVDEDDVSDDEDEMSDDEDEQSNFTKYRRLLILSKVKLRVVSSDAMDRIVMDQDEVTRLSVIARR